MLDTFDVARNRLARSMDFDPSYISRILSGQRRPADLQHTLRRLERKAEHEPVEIDRDTFKNMTITVWPESHALIEKDHSPRVSLLLEHPALVDALEHYEPTLF